MIGRWDDRPPGRRSLLDALEVRGLLQEGLPASLAVDIAFLAIQDVPDEDILHAALAVLLRGALRMAAGVAFVVKALRGSVLLLFLGQPRLRAHALVVLV